jgi:hypothetical protein
VTQARLQLDAYRLLPSHITEILKSIGEDTMRSSVYWRAGLLLLCCVVSTSSFLPAQPLPKRSDVTVKRLGFVASQTVRIRRDPASGDLYVLQNNGVIKRVNLGPGDTASFVTAYQTSDHGLNAPLGMTFDKNGTMYMVGNDSTGQFGTAMVVRGVLNAPGSTARTWFVIARTVPFPYGNIYNHRMSGIIVNADGDSIYVNSGAATDHGEMHNGYREVGLTSIIMKLPTNGDTTIILQDDREWLRTNGYLFAEGIRNTFDLAYGPNGDLFGVENSGDRDDPEELNWLRSGLHYGFPWRIGADITPQQITPYNPHTDPLLSPLAWGGGNLYVTFSNDPAYPAPPVGVTFTDPIPSDGPDADRYRDTVTGTVKDASTLGTQITTFTPHRSPDGIVFDRDSVLGSDLKGGAFVISLANSNLVTALGDTGGDLVHISLMKNAGAYSAHVTRIVARFNSPLGIELVDSALYVVETGIWNPPNPSPALWRIALPKNFVTSVSPNSQVPGRFALRQNWPNPFNPSTNIGYTVASSKEQAAGSTKQVGLERVRLVVYDLLGREMVVLVDGTMTPGEHTVRFDGKNLASGVYMYRLEAGGNIATRRMVLLK